MGRRSRALVLVTAGLAALAGVGVVAVRATDSPPAQTTPPPQPAHAHTAPPAQPAGAHGGAPQPAAARDHTPPPGVAAATLVARLDNDAPRYDSPEGPEVGTIAATWYDRPSVLPVLAQQHGDLEVRLAQRPNGSTAWIPAADATLESTPFHIVIHLSTSRLDLYRQGKLVLDAPAGIGTTADPTPTGHFFVAFLAAPPSAGYGPFVMVTSGHSTAISDWDGSGDALMAIHGPLGADAEIGTTGAQVSHGCVRLHVADLDQLRDVPPGTPVDVAP